MEKLELTPEMIKKSLRLCGDILIDKSKILTSFQNHEIVIAFSLSCMAICVECSETHEDAIENFKMINGFTAEVCKKVKLEKLKKE